MDVTSPISSTQPFIAPGLSQAGSGATTIAVPVAATEKTMLDSLTAVASKLTENPSKLVINVLIELKKSNPVEFANALVELADTAEVEEVPVSTTIVPTPVDSPVSPKTKKLTNEEKANLIAKLVASQVEDITPAVLQWTTYIAAAKTNFAGAFEKNDASRAKETAFCNKWCQVPLLNIPLGLARTAYSITKIVANLISGFVHLLSSTPVNCFGVKSKTEQSVLASKKWSDIKEDCSNALKGLGQALPIIGDASMRMLAKEESRAVKLDLLERIANPGPLKIILRKPENKQALNNWVRLVETKTAQELATRA